MQDLPGDGLDHAHAHHGQGAGEILHQVHDLAPFTPTAGSIS
jgi:hypothetical protein